jgi:pimeloyl-ACP methyl ester carboxylesterase
MKNLRTYGVSPYRTAVIHGGPGVPGEMAPVAKELSSIGGIPEPLQTAKTIQGQLKELEEILIKQGSPPVTLIGWSWGAWLGFIFAAQRAELVKKLILVSSGPFEEKHARNIMKIRLSRLGEKDEEELCRLIDVLEKPETSDEQGQKDAALERLGKLISKADSFDPIPYKNHVLECQYDIYQSVWEEAQILRSSGILLNYGKKIQCPVVAIHGAYDPHPASGIARPLSPILKNFKFILLEKCGHTPWIERWAKDRFFNTLKKELI